MEWSKVKNIIILILLLVNGFLLVQTVVQAQAARRYAEETLTGAVEVLRQKGYEVDKGVLPDERDIRSLVVERDRDSEEKLAGDLLGTVRRSDDSVRVRYEGERGSCTFRSDGSFAFTFAAGAYSAVAEGEEQEHAVELLSGVGYACVGTGMEIVKASTDAATGMGSEDRTTTVTICQTWEGARVFTCTAELTYENGALTAITGTRLIGTPVRDSGGGVGMDVPTALVRFMSSMREGGHVFTRVESLTAGYEGVSAGRRLKLTPTWQFTTDAGTFLMDAITGGVSPE